MKEIFIVNCFPFYNVTITVNIWESISIKIINIVEACVELVCSSDKINICKFFKSISSDMMGMLFDKCCTAALCRLTLRKKTNYNEFFEFAKKKKTLIQLNGKVYRISH